MSEFGSGSFFFWLIGVFWDGLWFLFFALEIFLFLRLDPFLLLTESPWSLAYVRTLTLFENAFGGFWWFCFFWWISSAFSLTT